ncbi:MAG: NADH-ubiquinone oxidoreductase-F iron-sulfur binding region domain-containing protein [Rubrivivax sp.]
MSRPPPSEGSPAAAGDAAGAVAGAGVASSLRRRRQGRGRPVDPAARAEVRAWFGAAPPQRDRLLEYLHQINDHLGQLPAPHLVALAEWMRLAPVEVYEVASFYHHFQVVKEDADGRVPAPPALTVRVCDGLPCELAGAPALLARLQAAAGPGVRVVAAPCVGRCEAAPVVIVGPQPVTAATPEAVQAVIAAGPVAPQVAGFLDLERYREQGGYTLLRDCVEGRRTLESVLAELDAANLRGLGGAGFPAGRKWRIVRERPAPRHLVVNLDEGEPGTFKDRWYLERDPHRFIEGMLVAAWAVGAERVWIYLRDEYPACRTLLLDQLARLRAAPPVPLPAIELRRGAGAYICGEESALIESIEGKRGLPRLRPPYVADVGLFGRPTLAHNFETLYWVRDIVERGGAWFASHGRHGRHGLRSVSVSGRVREPGVKLAPAGITLRELVDEFCGGMAEGHTLYAYLPGGASGGILPARLADLPLDFDTLAPHGPQTPSGAACFIGSAAVIVLSQHDRAADAARNTMRFFANESCGQCTPCRAGTAKALPLLDAERWDEPALQALSQVMRDASICGLGQAAPNVMDGVLLHFRDEVLR